MASDGRNDQHSYLYLGLAGETGPGRAVHTGLCRLADGSDEWEALQRGLPAAPAVRALAVHPLKPEIVYAGTQSGPERFRERTEIDHVIRAQRRHRRQRRAIVAVLVVVIVLDHIGAGPLRPAQDRPSPIERQCRAHWKLVRRRQVNQPGIGRRDRRREPSRHRRA